MSKNDPLGLFPEKTVAGTQGSPKSAGGGAGWVIVGILLGVAFLACWQRLGWDFSFGGDGDRQEQKEDGGKKVAAQVLFFIHERSPQLPAHDLLLREMPEWCKANGIPGGFRALDDDITDPPVPELIAFAKSHNVDPPFVAAVDAAGKPQRVIAWPSTIDGLKELGK